MSFSYAIAGSVALSVNHTTLVQADDGLYQTFCTDVHVPL